MVDYPSDEQFSLEDIIREFGTGISLPQEPEAAPVVVPPPVTEVQQPVRPVAVPVKDEDDILNDLVREFGSGSASFLEEPEDELISDEPEMPAPRERKRKAKRQAVHKEKKKINPQISVAAAQQFVEQKIERVAKRIQEPDKVRSAERIVRESERSEKTQALQLRICLVVSVVNILLTIYNGMGLHWIRGFDNLSAVNMISLVLMLIAAGSAFSVLRTGLAQCRQLKIGGEAMVSLITVAAISEAFFAIAGGRLCFCSLASLELLCALWASQRQAQATYLGALMLMKSSQLQGVKRIDQAWKGASAAVCAEGDSTQYEAMLEAENPQLKLMRIYAPIALALVLLLSVLGSVLYEINFLWLFMALLLAATPLSCCLSYALPYSLLASRLAWKKASICGWYGARVLGECDALLVDDAQLFPGQSLKLSGVKVFGSFESSRILRYAAAILHDAGSHVTELLESYEEEALPRVTELRTYDSGYSGEIEDRTVLVGTLDFLRQMGVDAQTGSKLRQALYVSIGGELAGLIALRYEATSAVRDCLAALDMPSAPTPLLAGQDILLTKPMMKAKFRLSLDRLVFIPMRERGKLPQAEQEDQQGALLAQDDLSVYGTVCMGAKALVTAVRTILTLGVIAGVAGMLIVYILANSGCMATVTCPQMFVYLAVWAASFAIACLSVLKS